MPLLDASHKDKAELKMKKGKAEGAFKEYYNNGKLYATGTYRQGLLHDLIRTYKPDGILAAEKLYYHGKLRFTKVYWQEDTDHVTYHFISKAGFVPMRDGVVLDLDFSAPDYLQQDEKKGDSLITYRFMSGHRSRYKAVYIGK